MRGLHLALIAVLGGGLPAGAGAGGGLEFGYRLEPGERWIAREASETRTDVMDVKSVTRSEQVIEYRVSRGPRKGWVTLAARVTSHSSSSSTREGRADKHNPLAGMTFQADMHRSGELRNYSFSGGDPRIAGFIGPAMKTAIFAFPEFPGHPLAVGDEFDVVSKMEIGGAQGMGGVQAVAKITYALEEVRNGLAYFSTRQRADVKAATMEVKDAGRGTAIFDLKAGMWIEHETKSSSQVPAGLGSGGSMQQIRKLTLEKAG